MTQTEAESLIETELNCTQAKIDRYRRKIPEAQNYVQLIDAVRRVRAAREELLANIEYLGDVRGAFEIYKKETQNVGI